MDALSHTWPTAHFPRPPPALRRVPGGAPPEAHHCGEARARADHGLTLTSLALWLHQPDVQRDCKLLLEGTLL